MTFMSSVYLQLTGAATSLPMSLLNSIRESQSTLATVSDPESGTMPDGESLEGFLSQLPPGTED